MAYTTKQIVRILITIAVIIAGCFLLLRQGDNQVTKTGTINLPDKQEAKTVKNIPPVEPKTKKELHAEIPTYVYEVLEQAKKFDKPFRNYVGGRIFQNRERKLPVIDPKGIKIVYKEWDVHPKIKGKNRGAERLVTGSNNSAYYTNDHYRSFIKINP